MRFTSPRWGGADAAAVRTRAAREVLPAIAFCGSFLPTSPRPWLQHVSWLAAVPWTGQALLAGALAAGATQMATVRRWPLFAVAALDLVARSSGVTVAVASFVAATTYRRPGRLVLYTTVATAAVLAPTRALAVPSALGAAPVFVWLPMVLGRWLVARRQLVAGLRERADRLQSERAAHADRARAQERARIARDMHDVLAHHVSLMVLHAGAMQVNAPDPWVASQADLIRTTGREALGQLRGVLGVLSVPPPAGSGAGDTGGTGGAGDAGDTGDTAGTVAPQPTLADLGGLIARAEAAGTPVQLVVEGDAGPLPPMAGHAAFRTVQEALTNVRKHAAGATARVTVGFRPRWLEVTVTNGAGRAAPAAVPGGGFGLTGLKERVGLLGGQLVAEPCGDGGFQVSARIPR